jgi:hypothetical protein
VTVGAGFKTKPFVERGPFRWHDLKGRYPMTLR